MKNALWKLLGSVCLVALLLFGSGAALASQGATQQTVAMTDTITFGAPTIRSSEDGLLVTVDGAQQRTGIPGQPSLPVLRRTYEFPLGTRIVEVRCTPAGIASLPAPQALAPVTLPVVPGGGLRIASDPTEITAGTVPASWFSYRLTGGLDAQDRRTTFLTLELSPVLYDPARSILLVASSFAIDIVSALPEPRPAPHETVDLVIITADDFASLLTPLVEHKQAHGLVTKVVTRSEICDAVYFPAEGRDCAEEMKYFVKAAVEGWNTTYVLLVGDFKKVPTRDSCLETDTGGMYEELDFPTDLYFADLYDGGGNFSSWDTDGDNRFAEWPYPEGAPAEDVVDMVPDVHLGRMACMTKGEVRTIVEKIIDYETNTAASSWFDRMVVIGGDTFDKSWEGGTDYNEGEVTTAKALEVMGNVTAVRLYASEGTLSTQGILDEISAGAGFVYFCGHGSPKSWSTHNNGDYVNWTGSFNNKMVRQLSNVGKYPVLMVGGCHNSEFDVEPINFVKGLLAQGKKYFIINDTWWGGFYLYNYIPECWSWMFVRSPGGAIATMGSAGFGGVNIGDFDHNGIPDCTEGMDGWFEIEFFRLYGQDGVDMLGQTYDQALTGYIHSFPVHTNRYDGKVVETHVFLGDPSLKIGGYE